MTLPIVSSVEDQETKRKPHEISVNQNPKKSKLDQNSMEECPILSQSVIDPDENARLERLWRSILDKPTKKHFEKKDWSKKKGSRDEDALEKENGESKEVLIAPQPIESVPVDAEPKATKKPKKRVSFDSQNASPKRTN
jgi:hypothetical protein